MISKIMEVDAVNKNILKIIAFDNSMPSKDLALIYDEFGYEKRHVDKSISIYRNVGLVLGLAKQDADYSADWHDLLDRYFPKRPGSKLDNVFVSSDYRKLLLVSNSRLVTVDLKNINEKLAKINTEIELYNGQIKVDDAPHKRSFRETLKGIFVR